MTEPFTFDVTIRNLNDMDVRFLTLFVTYVLPFETDAVIYGDDLDFLLSLFVSRFGEMVGADVDYEWYSTSDEANESLKTVAKQLIAAAQEMERKIDAFYERRSAFDNESVNQNNPD